MTVLIADGKPCGAVIDAPVTLEYRIEDRFSVPVSQRTFEHTRLRLLVPGGQTYGMALRGVAFWGWGLDGLQTNSKAAPLPGWLRDAWERRYLTSPLTELALSAWNGERGYRWALLHADDDCVLDVDPRASAGIESLGRFYRLAWNSPYAGKAVSESLGAQPIARAWWDAPTSDFASVETSIDLRNDAGDHATILARTRLRAIREGLRLLPMDLMADAIYNRGKRRPLILESLAVDGKPAVYQRDGSSLLVELPRALAAGEEIVLESRTQGDILIRPDGDSYWALGIRSWYPKPGLGGEERAAIHLAVESRGPFVPFAGGRIVRREKTATGNRLTTDLAGPMESAVALAGRYATYTEEAGRRVHVSTYAGGREQQARRIGRIVLGVSRCLEVWLDMPYPFDDLQVIEINDWGFGQAPPGIIFITKEAFLTRASANADLETRAMSFLTSRGINMRIAHEVAHGWFPHVMKVESPEEAWLSESFADYTSAVCLKRALTDKALGDRLWEDQLRDWKTAAEKAGPGASVYLLNWLSDTDKDQTARWLMLYGKGPWVLHSLRRELAKVAASSEQGDNLFFGWIRSAIQNHTYEAGKTADLVADLDRLTGRKWQPWFERYVYGTETPDLE
jgi:hypothetical protein